MKFVVTKQDGTAELVEAADWPSAVNNTPNAVSARIALYIDKVRFGAIEEEEKKDNPS